ncbi:MAG: alpha/beta hydrolase [Pseudomonadota bacterium]
MDWCSDSGVSIHYDLAGQGERTLVFIHELGGTLHSWDELVTMFNGDFRCLRFDQRGAGESEKVRSAFSADDHANDLQALLAFLGLRQPCVLVSLAAGATVALAFAQRYPAAVEALILCAPATGVSEQRRAYLAQRAALAIEHGMQSIAEDSLARSYPPHLIHDEAVYRRYRGRFLANDPLGYAHANHALMAFTLDSVVVAISMPCLLLAGKHDVLRPLPEIEQLRRQLPHAQLECIDSGHLMAVQNAAAVAAAMRAFFSKLGLHPTRRDRPPAFRTNLASMTYLESDYE